VDGKAGMRAGVGVLINGPESEGASFGREPESDRQASKCVGGIFKS